MIIYLTYNNEKESGNGEGASYIVFARNASQNMLKSEYLYYFLFSTHKHPSKDEEPVLRWKYEICTSYSIYENQQKRQW